VSINPRAGKPAEPSDLVNVPRLITSYFAIKPDISQSISITAMIWMSNGPVTRTGFSV